jgi:hypothetical protein
MASEFDSDTAEPRGGRMNHRYHYITIRPREEFTEFRTPLSAEDTPRSLVTEGCDVREGRLGPGTWVVQSVLIPRDAVGDRSEAEALAERIVDEREA